MKLKDFNGYMFRGINRYTYGQPIESYGFGRDELELIKQWFPLFNTQYSNIAVKTTANTGIIRQSRLSAALNPDDIGDN